METKYIGPSKDGWVERFLDDEGLRIYEIEGYSISGDNDVRLIIDRRKVDDVRSWNPGRAWRELSKTVDSSFLEAKQRFAETAGCTYHIVLYDDNEWARCYRIEDDEIEDVLGLVTFDEFGTWVFEHNDTEKLNKGFKNGLPKFDNVLRKNGTPWPSDLDGFWYDEGRVRALIEYQTTNKAKVANHSNNRYFHEDRGRWDTLNRLRLGVNRPLLIIVWSPNEDDNKVKVKKIDEIVFEGEDCGLKYESVEILERDVLVEHLESVV